jgi:hypothetical protein
MLHNSVTIGQILVFEVYNYRHFHVVLKNFLISMIRVVKLQMNSIKTSYNTITIYISAYTVLIL